jgi:hypothetical protein
MFHCVEQRRSGPRMVDFLLIRKHGNTTWRDFTETKVSARRPTPLTSAHWRFGKRPWARSTQSWRPAWKITRYCYERWTVPSKQSRLRPVHEQFGARTPD